MSAHGPDAETCDKAIAADLAPHKIDNTMAFMFETSQVLRPSRRPSTARNCRPTTIVAGPPAEHLQPEPEITDEPHRHCP
jgi:hypothetical protein